MRAKIFLILLLFNSFIFSQNKKELIGVWIKTKVETYDKKINSLTKQRDQEYIKYTFENGGNMYVSLTNNEKGNLLKYKVKGDIIDLSYNKVKIEKLNDKELVLVEFVGSRIRSSSTRICFVKEQYFLDNIPISKEDSFIQNNRAVYLETEKVYPKFKSNEWNDIKNYIQPHVEGLTKDMEGFSYSTFVIDKNGNVSDVRIHHHINRAYDRELEKSIQKTSGMWTAPVVNGKKVSALKEVSFHYIRFPKFTNDGEKLTIHPVAEIKDQYLSSFKKAVREYYKENYSKALEILDINSFEESDYPNIALIRSKLYKKLNDSINYQKTIGQVKNSNLLYVLGENE